jgi:hypothetical protein
MSLVSIRQSMASLLASADVDLGDERAVMRLLQSAGNSAGDIVTHSDAATERARELRGATNDLAVS